MFAKLATVFGLFAVAAQVAVAAPPACLIAAVNTQSNPSDMKTVCTSGAPAVQKYMSSNCGNALDAATSAWKSYCGDAGVTVSASSSSVSATATSSKGTNHTMITSASHSVGTAASSGFITATANGTYSAPHSSATAPSSAASGSSSRAPTATQSGVVVSTGAASRLGMDVVGLAAVGVFGAMLAL